ncbi:MAG: hypothetical protein A2Y81_09260 [Nitrospirae bacterium RBG_13_43_8]|nr:MAG: hypothetical protein A2Y81_09260 [Nitrospirae bacterium RBG_13_43_8]
MRICVKMRFMLLLRHSALDAESSIFLLSPASVKILQSRELLPAIFSCPEPTAKTSLHYLENTF